MATGNTFASTALHSKRTRFMTMKTSGGRFPLLICGVAVASMLATSADAEPILSLEAGPASVVAPGQTAMFDVYLRDYEEPFPVISFALNINASDSSLTAAGTDFSRFTFALDPDLIGVIGGLRFDDDISDDGRVEFSTDLPPFGSEAGIPAAVGDVRLGTLSALAPATPGSFTVGLLTTPSEPIFGGGSFLLLDDGSAFGQVLPGDGSLAVSGAPLIVVPEPSTLALSGIGGLLALVSYLRRWGLDHVRPSVVVCRLMQ